MPKKSIHLPELPSVTEELLDEIVKGPMTAQAVEDATLAFKKALLERALGAELSHHLGYREGDAPVGNNRRNGRSKKAILTDTGRLPLAIPRDRAGTFQPLIIGKHERRFTGFDDKIIAMYARGMSVREIRGYLAEMYDVDVSPDFISSVTDEVMEEVTTWQTRPLEPMYPAVFFDALWVKVREDGVVRNKAVYLALAVLPDGGRDILGIWVANSERAGFWLNVFNEIKSRGVADILIAVTDGLPGMEKALNAAFPKTTLQTCIVHLIRNSLNYASWKERKGMAQALRPIYTAATAEAAEEALNEFEQNPWGRKYLHAYETVTAAKQALNRYFDFYNRRRPHSALDGHTPDQVYFNQLPQSIAA